MSASGRAVSDVQKTAALRQNGIDQATYDRIAKAAQQDRTLQQRLASMGPQEPTGSTPRTRE